MSKKKQKVRACRVCGCTDDNCSQCIKKTGEPCYWIEEDLCSACEDAGDFQLVMEKLKVFNSVIKQNFVKIEG